LAAFYHILLFFATDFSPLFPLFLLYFPPVLPFSRDFFWKMLFFMLYYT
jgi:hypothetical protein